MNFKTTLALLVLAILGGALAWYGLQLPPTLDPTPPRAHVADGGTRAELARMKAADFTEIEITRNGRTTRLQRQPGGEWTMPGNWPVRAPEAQVLADRLASLRSRFEPTPLLTEHDFDRTGLRADVLVVRVKGAGNESWELTLGEARPGVDEVAFTRPTYLRLGSKPEAVRLAPGLVAELDRGPEYYQQRRLFDGERVAKDTDSGEKVERLSARSAHVQDTRSGGFEFTLLRKGDQWEIQTPKVSRDRPESRARDALLTAVPDIWAEYFVREDPAAIANLWAGAAAPSLSQLADAAFWITPHGLRVKSGLDQPERTLTVVRNSGAPVKLLIGRSSGNRPRKVLRPPPPGAPPGIEPREETIPEEYLYAQLENNNQIFEIKADKLRDVFVPLSQLRDAQVVAFSTADARKMEMDTPAGKIVLAKEKERWRMLEPVAADAEPSKVADLLSKLSGLQARDADIIDSGDLKTYGLDNPAATLVVTLEEEIKDSKGEKSKKERKVTLKLGKHDAALKKLYVQADDWPRINAVDDALDGLVRRPAVAYRGRRIFDFLAPDLAKLEIERAGGKYTLERSKDGWKELLGKPIDADTLKVDQLATTLATLEADEYASEAPKPDELGSQYGLDKPAVLVHLEFADRKKPAQTLAVGKARTGSKAGWFARLVDGDKMTPVFVIPGDVHNSLDHDALAYLPKQLWQAFADDVTAIRIHRQGEAEYRLVRDGPGWKVTGAFDTPALATAASGLVNDLASPQCTGYKTHEAKDLAEWGLDKPHLTVTLSTKEGKEHTLLIGQPTKDGSGRYAKVADRPSVFVVAEPLVKSVDRPALDLLDPVLLRLDPTQVQRIEAKTGDTSLTLVPKGDQWQATTGSTTTFLADPAAADTLRSIWSELRAKRYAAFGKVDWAKYGLDKPTATVGVEVKGGGKPATHTIEVGNSVEGDSGARYARVDRGAGLAVLPAATAKTLTATALDYVDHRLLDFDAAAVQSVKRQAGGDILELVKKDGWQIVKPADFRADDRSMQDLLGQLGTLRATRIAAYPAKDVQPFGLDKPAAIVTIRLNADRKPSEHVLRIGKVDHGGDRFAQVEGSQAIPVLPAGLCDRLLAAPLAFRDRTIAGFADADKAVLNRGPRRAVFALVDGSWKLTEPLEADADHDELADFVSNLAKLRADQLVVEKPTQDELHKFGLDSPEVHWRLDANNKQVMHLLVGNPEEAGGRRFAMVEGKEMVFLLDLKLTAKALAEYRTRGVWTPAVDAFQVDSVRYGYARNPFTLQKVDSNWEVPGKPDLKINTDTVNETLGTLAGLKLARYAVDKGADLKLFGLDHPELVLEVSTRTGKRTLEIGALEGGSRRRYARVPAKDRSDVFLLEEADLARILRDPVAFTKLPTTPPPPTPPPSDR
jgi:hypothetical protein